MKTGTILIIGAAGLAVIYILTRSKSKPASLGTGTTAALAGGAALGGLLSGLFSGSSSKSTSVASTGGGFSIPDTATSNYLADATAASDDSTGVVGFGGWD